MEGEEEKTDGKSKCSQMAIFFFLLKDNCNFLFEITCGFSFVTFSLIITRVIANESFSLSFYSLQLSLS